MRPDIVSRMVIFFVYYARNGGHATPTATGAKARGVARTAGRATGRERVTCEARERRARCRELRVGPAVSARRAAETRQLFSRCESLNAKWRREDVRSPYITRACRERAARRTTSSVEISRGVLFVRRYT